MNGVVALGTFSLCILISIFLYRYRAFITQIFVIGIMAVWLWSMSMMAYALNNKHNLLKMFDSQIFKIFDTFLEMMKGQEDQQAL